jgi:23S rRNA (guanosine2251-2'-O)-methyltransferase
LEVSELLEGRRPVLAALRAGRVHAVFVAQGAHHQIIDEIQSVANKNQIAIEIVPKARLDAWSPTGKHQGVIAEAAPAARQGWRAVISQAKDEGRVPFLILLDGIQDPGNLGALIRSAAAFGADAVLIPEARAASVTSIVAKAAAGALDEVPVEQVASLQAALMDAKEMGLWAVALAEEGAEQISDNRLLSEPLALIIGAEGRGVARTLRLAADSVVSIPTGEHFTTLNASVAGAIAMYEVQRARLVADET